MSFPSYEDYCNYFDTTFNKNVGESDSNKAKVPVGAQSSNASDNSKVRMRGKERSRPVKNRMLPSHWPPENAGELHLDRW